MIFQLKRRKTSCWKRLLLLGFNKKVIIDNNQNLKPDFWTGGSQTS